MKHYRGFNAENFKKLFNMRNVTRYNVFADDPTGGAGAGDPTGNPTGTPPVDPTGAGNGGTAPVNFETLIAKAREEEKNKLYPTIEKLKRENEAHIKAHNDDLIAIATKDKEIERLKGEIQTLQSQVEGKETDAIKALKKELKAAQEEVQTLKDSAPNVEELTAKIRAEIEAEYEIKSYKENKIREANGKIIPELVSGETKEDIDASVEKAMARYTEIVGTANPAPATPPVNPTLNPANPSSTPLKTSGDAMKKLLELDPLSKEYAEARKALGFK